jgi:peptidoglycan/xylan/chitin deacetylase (PgdA/CDA1 family)
MYHSVDPQPSLISISPDLFAWQMDWLQQHGCRVMSFGELTGLLSQGKPAPGKSVVLTFDDGLESLYTYAYPILAENSYPATIFLVAGYCGRVNNWPSQPVGLPEQRLLNWDQIREMDQNSIEFGAHTMTHPRLDLLSPLDSEQEILESKLLIEEKLGHSTRTFAYPYGWYNSLIKETVSRQFSGACSTNMGYVGSEADRYAIERIDINYYKSPLLFRQLFSPVSPPYLAARSLIRKVAGKILKRQWY